MSVFANMALMATTPQCEVGVRYNYHLKDSTKSNFVTKLITYHHHSVYAM